MDNPSIEITEQLPSENVQPVSAEKNKAGKILLIIGGIALLFLSLIGAYYLGKSQLTPNYVPSRNTEKITTTAKDESLALISYVPHFDNLKVDDLPNLTDVRSIVDYRGNKIVIAYNRFVEYDIASKKIVRQNNPDVLSCIYSGTVVGNNLYVGCNSENDNPSTLYKVDLDSGKIVKKYELFKDSGFKLVNLWLLAEGNTLWISSWDGVIKMDTLSQQTKFYSPTQIFSKLCKPILVWIENGQVKVGANDDNCLDNNNYHIGVYNGQTDSWQNQQITFDKYASLINHNQSDFSINIPRFYAVSQKLNEKYYLFSDEGIYTLQQRQFPALLFSINKNSQIASSYSAYVDKNEMYAIVVGGAGMLPQNPTIADLVFVNLINLQTKEVTNLISNHPEFAKSAGPVLQQRLENMYQAKLKESADGVAILDKDGQPFASVNFQKKSLIFH